ncbi:uncharacterized protein LOC134291264 [Aedes albopictus]|uniref:Endonuclease n=1 Tax=Aedes albopictus TaxID=7160 RepID=A0ABM1Z3Q8_AEDAL
MSLLHSPKATRSGKVHGGTDKEENEEENNQQRSAGAMDALSRKISVLSRQRKKAADKIKRIGGIVIDDDADVSVPKLKVYMKNVDAAYSEFNGFHNQLAEIIPDEEMEEHDQVYIEFEKDYHEVSSYIEEMQMDAAKNEAPEIKPQVIVQQQPLKAPIPTFDGRYENWPKFKAMFLDVMAKSNDTDAIKLYHLDKALVGTAAGILDARTMNENNYAHAWNILTERFENPRVIINTHIRGLLSLKKMTKESHRELRQLVDDCSRHIESLRYLKQDLLGVSELIVVHLLASALDPVTRKQWEATIVRGTLPKYEDMLKFLKQQCDILENCETSAQVPTPRAERSNVKAADPSKPSPKSNPKILAASTSGGSASSETCDFCGEFHKNFQCEQLQSMTVPQRVEKARSMGMCFNCLRKGHRLKDCPSDRKCLKCRQRHHTQLHDETKFKPESRTAEEPVPLDTAPKPVVKEAQASSSSASTPQGAHNVTSSCSLQAAPIKKTVLLLTAVVHVFDAQGKPHCCRVLLDCGSQVHLITKEMAERIGAKISSANVKISGVNNRTTTSMEKATVKFRSRYSDYRATVECVVTPAVTGRIPSSHIDVTDWCIPPGFQLADPEFNVPQEIDMLIGNELFFKIIRSGQYRLAEHLPELRDTHLGWVFTGELEEACQQGPSYSHTITVENVYEALQRFWTVEEVADQEPISSEEVECEKHFRYTHERTDEGRFVVQLPLKENASQLSDCRSVALKRFHLLEQCLVRNPCLREQYLQFIKEYEQLGHCKQIDESRDPSNVQKCYLPHHAVIRPDSSTTKCRVVFDASAKPSQNALSLNDVLKVGGTVQSDILDIVLRFRKHKYAFTADISKMYRQIVVAAMHQPLQRIFWRESPEQPLKVYQLTTVTYGTASAPFLATRCLVQLAEDGHSEYPLGASTVKEDFYVDDMLSGDDTLEAAIERQKQVKELLAGAGFPIHKWCSNSDLMLEHIPESERESPKALEEQGINTVIKVLGILWDPRSDDFLFSIKSPNFDAESESNTKRSILSEIAKLYDPLGFLAPVIVLAKLLMQQLWRSKVGWDEPVEVEIAEQWAQLKASLEATNRMRIPRRVLIDGAVCYELHGFADASMSAYGACVFIRSVLDESAQLQLLCSKSKVAPLKEITIPRLELCAALLLARLVNKVLQSIQMPFHRVVLWSDSQIVLAWLRKSPDQLQVFVRNRVAAIREETSDFEWMYVRSEFNPADIVSRGQMPNELVKNEMWWHGPDFLSAVNFENKPLEEISEEDIPELRATPTVLPAIEKEEQLKVFSKYSSFRKLQRVIALVLRFASNCKKKDSASRVHKTIPTVAELRLAMDIIVKVVQREEFYDEIARVESGERCRQLGSLGPILVNGVLRVGGRLEHSNLPYNEKHPIILPSQSPIVRMLIRALHEEHLHLGPTGLVHVIRRDFWLINAAATVRGVTRSCVKCFKVKPVDTNQFMGNLPSCRVTPAPPFSVTGVDYAGPFHIKQGLRKVTTVKGYVAVFVCMVTRAVHLELVSDMTTSAFIAALQRFVSRRGIVHQLHSDNGTNFRGAHHELNQLYQAFQQEQESNQIASFCTTKGIEWQFIPADAPEFGGIWEAAVKSMKSHLKRVVGNSSLNFEQYATILTEIEAILNSRPLFVTSAPDGSEVITPAHYLIGRPLTAIPEPSYEDIQANRLDKWQHLQMLREHFWKAWSRDYLSSLQPRKKNQKLEANVIPGMIVLVHNRNLPPLQWKLGVVTKTFPGADGLVRAVDVYSDKSTFRRPINKLSILPIEDNKAYFGAPKFLK